MSDDDIRYIPILDFVAYISIILLLLIVQSLALFNFITESAQSSPLLEIVKPVIFTQLAVTMITSPFPLPLILVPSLSSPVKFMVLLTTTFS